MSLKTISSAVLLASVVGCASGGATKQPVAVSPAQASLTIAAAVGEYALVTVDGRSLPYAPRLRDGSPDPSILPLVSGTFTLKTDGTFRLESVYARPGDQGSTSAFSGACYTEGEEMKMVWDGGGSTNFILRGDTVVLKREGAVFAYTRRR